MNLKGRVKKLEAEHGVSTGGRCMCSGFTATRVILPTVDGSTPEGTGAGEKCDVCGGEILVIRVVYVEGRKAA
jgi:hypothetical protein